MKVTAYARTHYCEDLGEHDLDEQLCEIERYCQHHKLELINVVAEGNSAVSSALTTALAGIGDGVVVTDALVLADDLDEACDVGMRFADSGKHLFIVYHDKHIDPCDTMPEQQLVNSCLEMLDHEFS